MALPAPELEANQRKVFKTVRKKVAMPLLDVAQATDISLKDLQDALDKLAKKRLITVKEADDPLSAIVSVDQKYL